MKQEHALFLVYITVLSVYHCTAFLCPQEPSSELGASGRSPGDNGYRILISGEPEKYVPGSVYTLSIVGSRTHGNLQQFTRFMLQVEPIDPTGDPSPQKVGSFQLFGDSLTTFNQFCLNTVSESDDLPKTEVQVMWISPPRGSGCVVFKAMVYENKNSWFSNDGALTREICELAVPVNEKEDSQDDCCACDEAKYQLIFEGIWSNKTHPRDFPFSLWLTHFSDVIGASHERNFSFWGEGQIASDGLRQVAEWGSVRGMEAELKAKSKHLRTLIKAGGLWYPRVNTNTTSNFRVDRKRHLISVVSMLGPSPDWIVGVNGLNLCQKDCSWVEEKIVDLYPYDAGTDSGITYMSPNTPTRPQEKIYRITTMYPEDPRAPFYDPTGAPMNPLARLYLFRESIVPKSCDDNIEQLVAETVDVAENTEDTTRPECAVTDYSEWSSCSVSCGKGLRMRQRSYIMPQKAEMLGCNRQLISKEMCVANQPTCPGDLEDDELPIENTEGICATTPWGLLSECSVTCGEGVATRTRKFLDRMGRKKCPHVSLIQREPCSQPACPEGEPQEVGDPMCPVTPWSDWSPCSASCGKGVKFRTRLLLVPPELQEKCSSRLEFMQQRPCVEQELCSFDRSTAKQVCMMEPETGPCRGFFERWYFNAQKGMCIPFTYGGCRGNRNNFLTSEECQQVCGIFGGDPGEISPPIPDGDAKFHDAQQSRNAVDCMVSDWSAWTDCSVSCGTGIRERFRMIKVEPQNGGKPCPKRLVRRKKCHRSCNHFNV